MKSLIPHSVGCPSAMVCGGQSRRTIKINASVQQALLGTCRLRNAPQCLAGPHIPFPATTYQWKLGFCCYLLVLQGQQSWLCSFTGCIGFPGGLILFQPPISYVFPLSWWGTLGSYPVTSKPFLTKTWARENAKIMFYSIQNRCSYKCLNFPSFLTCLHKDEFREASFFPHVGDALSFLASHKPDPFHPAS